jgi:hypothetical protein
MTNKCISHPVEFCLGLLAGFGKADASLQLDTAVKALRAEITQYKRLEAACRSAVQFMKDGGHEMNRWEGVAHELSRLDMLRATR